MRTTPNPIGRLEDGSYAKHIDMDEKVCTTCLEAKPATLDHNHETETNRELLCNVCNRVLGLFGDDIERFLNAALYLIRHQGGDVSR